MPGCDQAAHDRPPSANRDSHFSLDVALATALVDELQAAAFYEAANQRFGPWRKFENLAAAERRHASALARLRQRLGLPALNPDDIPAPEIPNSMAATLRHAVDHERENIAMFDQMLTQVDDVQVRRVLEKLRNASRDRHLPALQRGSGAGRGGAGQGGRDMNRPIRRGRRGGWAPPPPSAGRHQPTGCSGGRTPDSGCGNSAAGDGCGGHAVPAGTPASKAAGESAGCAASCGSKTGSGGCGG